jgi:rhodanese-related sulfurtransferase
VILEALLVAAVGFAFALLANALSPLGLRLTRNYFPAAPLVATNTAPLGPATNALAATVLRLQQRGLQPIGSNDVVKAFRDPQYQQGLFVFIDARDDQHYQAGHIPGALQFNHYRPEQFLPTVLPLCQNAQKVVVYCGGGACEDSEFAALMLRDGGVPAANLYVYIGGIAEWTAHGLPVEIGARGSGQVTNPQ